MPASYREPLVLFYRQENSVAEVAKQLDLTEDTVKQRLSRGRAMLREEMTALVESTLARTKPGRAFTAGVLVALPMVSATSASAAITAGAAAGSGVDLAGRGILAKIGLGAMIGPVIGLVCAYLGTMAAASTARSKAERECILRYSRGMIAFCFVMSIGLAAVLSQAGKLYDPSAGGVVLGVSAWTVVLVGGIMLVCVRMDRAVGCIRIETKTTDEAFGDLLSRQGKSLRLPRYFESKLRVLGVPLFAMAWGGYSSDQVRRRVVCGWVAVGDVAISPFLAFGGVAIGPIALGAVSLGVLSLSVFWGVAVGVLAAGSLAFGWWAIGCAAAGVKCALGFAALSRDYAVGLAASAADANTSAAKEWIRTQWLLDVRELIVEPAHWWILLSVVIALALRTWRAWQLRRKLPG